MSGTFVEMQEEPSDDMELHAEAEAGGEGLERGLVREAPASTPLAGRPWARAAVAGVCVLALAAVVALVASQAAQAGDGGGGGDGEAQGRSPAESLFDEHWAWYLEAWPMTATYLGEHAYDAGMPDLSPEGFARRHEAVGGFLARAEALLDGSAAGGPAEGTDEWVDLGVFRWQLALEAEGARFHEEQMPMSQRDGPQLWLGPSLSDAPVATDQQAADAVRRLGRVPQYLAQMTDNLRAGLAAGRTPPREILAPVQGQLETLLSVPAEESSFYKPFRGAAAGSPGAAHREDALKAVRDSVYPAFQRLLAYWRDEYVGRTRETLGATALPDGRAYYDYRVRHETTLDEFPPPIFRNGGAGVDVEVPTPHEGVSDAAAYMHALGLADVDRIEALMRDAADRTDYPSGTPLPDVFNRMRSDARLFAQTPAELMRHVRDICKRADYQLPRLFRRLPRCPYGVEEIPPENAPHESTAYYAEPDRGCTYAGTYSVNTYHTNTSRPLYLQESTSLHESVPGHHLQIALANEREGAPVFRTRSDVTAFVEGWALYAESLGDEMGFYTDPFTKLGSLGDEMLRACRLVVDTGIHAMGWSRERAVNYMLEKTPLSRDDVVSEVDRYSAWPGQALAYKTGQLTIRALRAAHPAPVNIRDFHSAVLDRGALPMPLLIQSVNSILAKVRTKAGYNFFR